MTIVLDKEQVGIMAGQVGIGIMAFPWVYVDSKPQHSVSFWEWLICRPRIDFSTTKFKKFIQFRFMWFVIQITT